MRVCKGVRGLETNVRDGLEGFGGRVRAECGCVRNDAGCGWRAEDGRRSRSLDVAFMLAGLLVEVYVSIGALLNVLSYRRSKQYLNSLNSRRLPS